MTFSHSELHKVVFWVGIFPFPFTFLKRVYASFFSRQDVTDATFHFILGNRRGYDTLPQEMFQRVFWGLYWVLQQLGVQLAFIGLG